MNYVFENVKSGYRLAYRHDEYGTNNPGFKMACSWVIKYKEIYKGSCNLLLAVM